MRMKIELNLSNDVCKNSGIEFKSKEEFDAFSAQRAKSLEIPFGYPFRYPCLMIFNESFLCHKDTNGLDRFPAIYLYEGEYKIGEE